MSKEINENTRLSNLLDNQKFKEIYSCLLIDQELELKAEEFILTCILILFSYYDKDKRFKKTFSFAYHILLLYSIRTNNYRPLFDISIELGLFPITRHILIKKLLNDSEYKFQDIISGIYIKETYFNNAYTSTKSQSLANKYLLESQSTSLAYIAPTSFGKSSIIKDIIKTERYNKICIVAPSKSLIQQNFKNFIEFGDLYSIIYHDKMYTKQEKVICIVTQERAMRLLQKIESFDIIFIDEAHNLFDFDKTNNLRGLLLSKFIGISKKRSLKTKLIYLSPLVNNIENLRTIGLEKIDNYVIKNNIKSEIVYYYRDSFTSIYDKYTGSYFSEVVTDLKFQDYIISNSSEKNFIYNFKPKNIELLAKKISKSLNLIKGDNEIIVIKNTLINEVHKEFNIVDLIDYGIVYLHAKMPAIIKEYLEVKFKKVKSLKYLVANSVILEGINLPIDTLFITSASELNQKKLINLIGRVNRLDQVFNEENLNKLICNIHFVEDRELNRGNSLKAGIERLRIFEENDLIKNPLLQNYDIKNLDFTNTKDGKTKEEKFEERNKLDNNLKKNFDLLILNDGNNDLLTYLLNNNFEEIYSVEDLPNIVNILKNSFKQQKEGLQIMDLIHQFLINDTYNYIKNEAIRRLYHEPTRKYYKHYLETIRKLAYKDAIKSTYAFFIRKSNSADSLLYFGETYGDVIRENPNYKSFKKVYINLSDPKYEYKDLINLAIVKLKIEEDFVSYELNKLVNLLYDFDIIDESEYNLFSFGTNDDKYLKYLFLGISISTIKKLVDDNQLNNLSISSTSLLKPNNEFKKYLDDQSELFKFEINKYIQFS